MPYVQRDQGSKIIGRFAKAQPGYAEEFLADDSPEIAALDAAAAAEAQRLAGIDSNISGFSFGGKTLAQLKAMDAGAFDTWWSANITNLAQANAVLKLLARAALRRVV